MNAIIAATKRQSDDLPDAFPHVYTNSFMSKIGIRIASTIKSTTSTHQQDHRRFEQADEQRGYPGELVFLGPRRAFQHIAELAAGFAVLNQL